MPQTDTRVASRSAETRTTRLRAVSDGLRPKSERNDSDELGRTGWKSVWKQPSAGASALIP